MSIRVRIEYVGFDEEILASMMVTVFSSDEIQIEPYPYIARLPLTDITLSDRMYDHINESVRKAIKKIVITPYDEEDA